MKVNLKEDGTIEGYLTVIEFAIKHKVSDTTIRRLCQLKRIPTIKVLDVYLIPEDYKYIVSKPGRKKGE